MKARDAEIELLKRDRDGQNKKVGELAKEIDAIKKAAMSEEERKKAKEAERLKRADAEQAGFERAKKDQTKGTPPAGGGLSEGCTTTAAFADGAVVFRCPNRWPKRPRPTIPRSFSMFSRPPAPPTT